MELDGPTSFLLVQGLVVLAGAGALTFLGTVLALLSKKYRRYGMRAFMAGLVGGVLGVGFAFALSGWAGLGDEPGSVMEQWAVIFGLSWFGLGAGAAIIMPILWTARVGQAAKRPA